MDVGVVIAVLVFGCEEGVWVLILFYCREIFLYFGFEVFKGMSAFIFSKKRPRKMKMLRQKNKK